MGNESQITNKVKLSRILLATSIAPFLVGCLFGLLLNDGVIFKLAVVLGYIGMLAGGLPYALILRHFNRLSMLPLVVGGFVWIPLTMFILAIFSGKLISWEVKALTSPGFFTMYYGAVGIAVVGGLIAGVPLRRQTANPKPDYAP